MTDKVDDLDPAGCRDLDDLEAKARVQAGRGNGEDWDAFRDAANPSVILSLIERVRRAVAEHGIWTMFKDRAADRLADEVAVLVKRHVIDARSPAGDALLDYRDPPCTEKASRIAALEADRDRLTRELEEAKAELICVTGHLSLRAGEAEGRVAAREAELAEIRAIATESIGNIEGQAVAGVTVMGRQIAWLTAELTKLRRQAAADAETIAKMRRAAEAAWAVVTRWELSGWVPNALIENLRAALDGVK